MNNKKISKQTEYSNCLENVIRSYILVKFFSEKNYLDQFVNGSLYLNSLYYFWNDFNWQKKRYHNKQNDMFEGTIGLSSEHTESAGKIFGNHLLSDSIFRSVGMGYCNVLCFYKVNFSIYHMVDLHLIRVEIDDINMNMKEFGKYVAVIIKPVEFIKRIEYEVLRQNQSFVCGPVMYHSLKKSGKITEAYNRHHLIVHSDEIIDMNQNEFKNMIVDKRDCFDKDIMYKDQNEWRIALYRNKISHAPYRLEIGDIQNLVKVCKASDLTRMLDHIVCDMVKNHEKNIVGYYGNISRKQLREKFYALGKYNAEMFEVIG